MGGSGCRLCGSTCWICHRRWAFAAGTEASAVAGGTTGLAGDRHIRCRAPIKPSLQTVDLFQQCLLLLFHLAKQFSNRGVLGLHRLDFVFQVVFGFGVIGRDFVLRRCLRWVPQQRTLFSGFPEPGFLSGGDSLIGAVWPGVPETVPEAEVVNNVTDVNANATESLMYARSIDMLNLHSECHPEMIEVMNCDNSPSHGSFP